MSAFGTAGTRRGGSLLALALAAAALGSPGLAQAGTVKHPAAQVGTVTKASTLTSALTAGKYVVTSPLGAAAAGKAVTAAGGKVLGMFTVASAVAAWLPAGAVLPAGVSVVPNSSFHVASADTPQDGVTSTVRATLGLGAPNGEGAGVTVAVVDTGVADTRDLAGRLTHVNATSDPQADGYGHGTFVAGLIAGDGASSGGKFAGVAPGANILDVKVGRNDGTSDLFTVLRGLQAVADNGTVDVLNLSLNSDSPLPYQIDPLDAALENLWHHGVTVVVPAGNNGESGPGSVASPGSDPVLLTVGSADENGTASRADDTVSAFSGQGPTQQGDAKPDLVAPGTHVVSLAAPGSLVDTANPGSRIAGGYFRGSGTSFSTAVTSGAAAVLDASTKHGLNPAQTKNVLTSTAYTVPGGTFVAGAGGLDLAAALNAKTNSAKTDRADQAPGQDHVWATLIMAGMNDDQVVAAQMWANLSPASKMWAAQQWASLSPESQQWVASQWAGKNWVDASSTEGGWAARQWAASQWSSHNWVENGWTAKSWVASQWAADEWAAHGWSASSWTAHTWTASSWTAHGWSASSWTAHGWSASSWTAHTWTSNTWSASDWDAHGWSASSWAASSWASHGWSSHGWSSHGWASHGWA